MRRFLQICLLGPLCWAGIVLAKIDPHTIPRVTSPKLSTGKFIVEFESASDIPSRRSSVADDFFETLEKRAPGTFQVEKRWDSPVFKGASIRVTNDNAQVIASELPGVKAIRPVVAIPGPKPVFKKIITGPNDEALPPDTQSSHVMAGVDKLHALNITGAGLKIGILDTGVDYNHPALGAGFGPGFKVAGGFDFVGDAYTGENEPVPDPDPLDCNGHGTHVSGIIGADPTKNDFGISGVAYDASLFMFRVFGCDGFVTDDVLIDALIAAFEENVDVVSLSLGGPAGWTESSSAVVASNIADAGKVVTISAGNEGADGTFFSSSPGNGISVIGVASVDNTQIPSVNATTSDPARPIIPYFQLAPLPVEGALPIFVLTTDTTVPDDACAPLPDDTPDLSGFVTIIRRGTCPFFDKLTNAAAKGAQAVLIYNNGGSGNIFTFPEFPAAALISTEDGEYLVEQFVAGTDITLSFPDGPVEESPNPTGGLVSDFSTYGPTNDMFFKPSVAAPGGLILSTVPLDQGGFAVFSGTSMAAPFVAGSSALILQTHGKTADVARGTRFLLETTAAAIPSAIGDTGPLQTLTKQGAGLINAFNAVTFKTVVTPGELLLNDTAHFRGSHTITIRNTGTTSQTYRLSHIPAGTAPSFEPGAVWPVLGPVPLLRNAATVRLSATTVTVRAGGSTSVTATISAPTGLDASTLPAFSGFIQIASSTETLKVSYLGVVGNLKNAKIVDNSQEVFPFPSPALINATGFIQEGPTTYTFVGDDFPILLWRQNTGTPKLNVDWVASNFRIVNSGSFAAVPIVGPFVQLDYLSRNSLADFYTFAIDPTFANGTTVRNGSYRLLVRALRITGNPTAQADYESYITPIIIVRQ